MHFVNGALGTVLTGLFATDGGLFYGGGFGFLGVQILGVLAVCTWVGVAITLVFFLLKKTIGLRVSREEEIDGLDIHEHGLISAYADFAPMSLGMVSPEVQETVEGAVPAKSAHRIQRSIAEFTRIRLRILWWKPPPSPPLPHPGRVSAKWSSCCRRAALMH